MNTKLVRPSTTSACARPRVFHELDQARRRSVIWVSGPAGSGKSTLLATYLEARQLSSVWYNVDERDADPASLFYYLRSAAVELDVRAAELPLLAVDHPVHSAGFAIKFFDSFFEHLPPDGVLVFDDCPPPSADWDRWYQLALQAAVASSEGRCVVFLARAAAPAKLARFLAGSKLALISADQLRFSNDDGRAFILKRAAQLEVAMTEQQVDDLLAQTEGWAAGIALALEWARVNGSKVVEALARRPEETFQYFASEVWDRTAKDLQQFLLETACLPSLSEKVLDQLYGSGRGAGWLARLKAEQAFVTEQRGNPVATRYHGLFRAFLLSQVASNWPVARSAQSQRSAGAALAAVGQPEAALDLLLNGADFDAAVLVVLAEAPAWLVQGRSQTLASYLRRFPQAMLDQHPWLAVWMATAQLNLDPHLAVTLGERALLLFEIDRDPKGYWLAWRTFVLANGLSAGGYDRVQPLIHTALQRLRAGAREKAPPDVEFCRNVALVFVTYVPDEVGVASCAELVLTGPLCSPSEDLMLALFFYGFNGELQQLHAVTDRAQAELGAMAGDALVSLALCQLFLACFTGEFPKACSLAGDALELSARFGQLGVTNTILTYWAYALLANGEAEQLAKVVRRMAQSARAERGLEISNYRFICGLEALLNFDAERALTYLRPAYAVAQRSGVPVAECAHGLGLCEALCSLERFKEARDLLERVVARIARRSLMLRQSAELLRAAIDLAEHGDAAGEVSLRVALALGREQAFIPLPVPTRACLRLILQHALRLDVCPLEARELSRRLRLPITVPISGYAEVAAVSKTPPPAAFVRAVRIALRRLHETNRLLESPLLKTLFLNPSGAKAEHSVRQLRQMLLDAVKGLANNARTEPFHRALQHTFVQPATTQLLAAELAVMSFGTYRRHLRAGIEQVATDLWISAGSQTSGPVSPRSPGLPKQTNFKAS